MLGLKHHCHICGTDVEKWTESKKFGKHFCSENHAQLYAKRKMIDEDNPYAYMCCNSSGKITRKKIVILSSLTLGIVVTTYAAFTLTHNPGIAATIPALLSVAACPIMCVGMCGVFWVAHRLSGKSNNENESQIPNPKKVKKILEDESCSCDNNPVSLPNQKLQPSKFENENNGDVDTQSYNIQAQKNNFKN